MINHGVSLSILIVEDSDEKLNSILDLVNNCQCTSKLEIAKDQISAQRMLLEKMYDLLILDMQLPLRIESKEVNEEGGQNILEDLFTDENYKMPGGIIALTEFENLENKLRETYPEVAVLRFDLASNRWRDSLTRRVISTYKSKTASKKVVYCEGHDMELYNLVNFPSIEFRALNDSRAIYLAVKNEKDKFGLRDRDFLTNYEIEKLKTEHSNYFILKYYCLENYLYHPDNILEINPTFDKLGYINDIKSQKNNKLLAIVQDYKLSRASYHDLLDNDKRNMDRTPENDIIKAFESEDFETYYKYFDMAGKKDKSGKKSYDKTFLSSLCIGKEKLAQTKWFESKIKEIILL